MDMNVNHLSSDKRSTNITSSRSRRLYHVDVTDIGEPCVRNELMDRAVDPSTYEFGCRDIEYMLTGPKTLVGSGSVRDVWLVEYQGRQVAVKTLRHIKDQRHRDMHTREMLTMDVLRQERNVIGMVGVCKSTVVTEYYSGSLLHYVWRHGQKLAVEKLVDMSIDAAKGLQALHEIAGGLHIDLKPMQLLVDEGGRPLTETTDVYSLGMIFYSLLIGGQPFDKNVELLELALQGKYRPPIDPSWPAGYTQIVEDMWLQDPKRRPSAGQVVARLQDFREGLQAQSTPGVI
eukprot:g16331.t1